MTWLLLAWRFKGVIFAALLLFGLGGFHAVKVQQAYQRGVTQERIVWQERAAREAAKREAERVKAQADLDAITAEAAHWEAQAAAERARREEAVRQAASRQRAPVAIPDDLLEPLREVGR